MFKNWYNAFCTVLVTILFFVIIGVGMYFLPNYLKLIPIVPVLIGLSTMILIGFAIDFVFCVTTLKFEVKLILERWGLFFKSIGLFFTKFDNILLIVMIIIGLVVTSCFTVGVINIYGIVYNGTQKAIKYDAAIQDVRNTYQNTINKLVEEKTQLKIQIDQKEKQNDKLNDELFLADNLNKQLQVEIKRLLPKGAKKDFPKALKY